MEKFDNFFTIEKFESHGEMPNNTDQLLESLKDNFKSFLNKDSTELNNGTPDFSIVDSSSVEDLLNAHFIFETSLFIIINNMSNNQDAEKLDFINKINDKYSKLKNEFNNNKLILNHLYTKLNNDSFVSNLGKVKNHIICIIDNIDSTANAPNTATTSSNAPSTSSNAPNSVTIEEVCEVEEIILKNNIVKEEYYIYLYLLFIDSLILQSNKDISKNYDEIKEIKKKMIEKNDELKILKNSQNNLIDKENVSKSELNDLNNTNKRLIEINMNLARRKEYMIKMLQIILIVLCVFILIPILKKLRVLNLKMALGIWGTLVLVLLLVSVYLLYFRINNRDKSKFDEYLFANPNSEEILKSKLNVELSDSELARCEINEEMNPNDEDDTFSTDLERIISESKNKESQNSPKCNSN